MLKKGKLIKRQILGAKKSFYNPWDGHIYWYEGSELMAAPVNADGTIDINSKMNTEDFYIKLSETCKKQLFAELAA